MSANGSDVNSAYVADMECRVADINYEVAMQKARPCNIKRVHVTKYGEGWCCSTGDGYPGVDVMGFGATPEEACKAFDKAWVGEK